MGWTESPSRSARRRAVYSFRHPTSWLKRKDDSLALSLRHVLTMATLRSLTRSMLRAPRQRIAPFRAFSAGLHLSQQFAVSSVRSPLCRSRVSADRVRCGSPMNTAEYNAISNQTMDSLTDYLEEVIETIAKDGYDVEYSVRHSPPLCTSSN